MTSTNNMLIRNGLLDGGTLVHGTEGENLDEFLNEVDLEQILSVNNDEGNDLPAADGTKKEAKSR